MTAPWWQPRDGHGTWQHTPPHRELRLTVLGTLTVCLLLAALFAGALKAAEHLMCQLSKDSTGHGTYVYCPDFTPTEDTR